MTNFMNRYANKQTDISIRLEQLQEAENNYYITAKYVLDLTNRCL